MFCSLSPLCWGLGEGCPGNAWYFGLLSFGSEWSRFSEVCKGECGRKVTNANQRASMAEAWKTWRAALKDEVVKGM